MSPRSSWSACATTLLAASCSANPLRLPPEPAPVAVAIDAGPSAAPPSEDAPKPGHFTLVEPRLTPLDFTVEPVAGGRSVLLVSQFAGERVAWARRVDGATGVASEPVRFVDQHVFAAYDWPDGATSIATSDGARICLTSTAHPGAPSCAAVTPSAIVATADRLAFLELAQAHLPDSPPVSPPSSPSPPSRDAKAHAKPHKPGKARPGATGRHAARPTHPLFELRLRWVDRAGAFEPEARPTGLHFEAPIDGMTLVDARSRPPGIDVLWFETAPKRKSRTPLGSGRLMAATVRADGNLDFASRTPVLDGDLEYGTLKDHRGPRLVGSDLGTAFVDLDAKGHCEVFRVLPTHGFLAPAPLAACAVAPDRLSAALLEPAELAAFERILADDPRRAPGQPRTDPGLVAWAGERAYYRHGATLRSAARADGAPRDEPTPFPARRVRIRWGAFLPDGEGVAFAGGAVVHVDARGASQPAPRPPGVIAASLAAPEEPIDRRRVARIGHTFWLARGERTRVFPEASAPSAGSARRRPVDASVLVGGPARGLSLDIAGAPLSLHVASMDEAGAVTALGAAPSPVRVGFDACERAAGGALVAGVSATDPAKVVAFVVDAAGSPGRVSAVPLPVRAGELAVRMIPLPTGGALLTDAERRHVVWLDDEAHPVASTPWPTATSDAACLDGRPARLVVPGITPGELTRVPDVAEGACVVGDPVWARDGSLRWFGSAVGGSAGLDSVAEAAVVRLLPAIPVAPADASAARVSAGAPAAAAPMPAACPGDMVSIRGRYCIDRFEGTVVDARTGEALSPDFPTTPNLLDFVIAEWSTAHQRIGNVHARAFPLPFLAPARLGQKTEPLAVSRLGVRPSGYLTGIVAEGACAAAGKRLCTLDEFSVACRGEDDKPFPYGDTYVDGACNVFREEHPAALLHNNASIGHLDPRLNRVLSKGRPLLQRTGDSLTCRSRWGSDAAYDLVGNIDEWINEGTGAFAGGFYARSTRAGCDAVITAHPKGYLDYSTGLRCCRDAGR